MIVLSVFLGSSLQAEEINISTIDLQKLHGMWLEIARTPNFLQRSCDYSAMNFDVSDNEEILITKLCIAATGNLRKQELHASLANNRKQRNAGKQMLFVEYTGVMRFFRPFTRGNLMIFYVNDDYTQAIIGSPDKSSFWLLSRDLLSLEQTQDLLNIAADFGLVNNKLIFNNFDEDSRDKVFSLFENYNNKN
ncbi:MAG: lipocalin family protein [Alphaproteobacteria bacterium]|jgi:apolipoprotein D and lipocalin family protein|nr:lipocalin family protein [Alphaproteobacteria bacterium]